MKKILFALPFIAALTACGGGGSGGGSSPAPSQDKNVVEEPAVETKQVVTSEAGTKSVPVSNTSNLTYTVKENSDTASSTSNSSYDWLDVQFTSDSVVFNIGDVDRPYNLILEFTDKDSKEIVFKVSLFVDNASGKELVSKVERAISQSERILSLEDDKKIYFYIVDMLYLQDMITHSEKQENINAFNPEGQASYNLASNYMFDLKKKLAQYNKSMIDENALQEQLSLFESALITHGQYGSDAIESLQQLNVSGLPSLPNTDFAFSNVGNLYSRFIGNENYGQWVNGNWTYNSSFEFLSSIVNVNLAGTCSI